MKLPFDLTIALAFKVLFGSMILLMVGAVALPLASDISAQVEAKRVVRTTTIARAVFTAMQNARVWRSTTRTALLSPGPASERFLTSLEWQRSITGAALATTVQECATFACASDPSVSTGLPGAIGRLEQIKTAVDRDLRKPLTERQAGIAETFNKRSTDVVDRLETISLALGALIRDADAQTAQLIELKELAWLVRDGFGFERVKLTDGILEGTMTPQGEEAYQRLRGKADGSWAMIRSLMARSGAAPEIAAAIAAAQMKGFEAFRPLSDQLHRSLVDKKTSTISIDQITDVSKEALEAVTKVAETAMRLAEQRAIARQSATWNGLALRLTALTLSCLLGVAGLFFMQRRLIGPMQAMTRAMGDLAGGDERITIVGATRTDEFGAMAKSVEVFRHNIIRRKTLEKESEETKRRMEDEKRHTLTELGRSFEGTVSSLAGKLATGVMDLTTTAHEMAAAAERTRDRSEIVSKTAASAARNVEAAATASDDLSASAQEVGTQIRQTAKIAAQAVVDARKSHETIEALVRDATAIGSVVSLINQIATRTNLLALNATIEAARAGEAGRGFAVVAMEVKELANQTILATVQIRTKIEAIQQTTAGAFAAIESVSDVVEEVNAIARSIATAAEQQRIGTQDIATEMTHAAVGAGILTDETASVRETANHTGVFAARVVSSAEELARFSAALEGEIRRFVDHVWAA